ncbi:hypothetical protein CLDAP_30000 [Caldilinea aerophila DSM 14535 = NBRC 104270]|uniref:Uncharacterized protein n=1 Tax=Caldilinea aerophila (strain DSM 14535 / JCM 11387 / NBRC 104270 / STL-6-O1) TaxID=926550 RepID=I0I702_CALAS|nr:hypothetical protein CLDAP_30000 [Caldilinea aerophila DSM 14535 = NBRC 104270]
MNRFIFWPGWIIVSFNFIVSLIDAFSQTQWLTESFEPHFMKKSQIIEVAKSSVRCKIVLQLGVI